MCGIAGYADLNRAARRSGLDAMLEPLHHRGPDDTGAWLEDQIALGHKRLSIIDLSAAGHQPMLDRTEQWVVVYNGEIYNHQTLRNELPGPWTGHSDTEVLVAALNTWGVTATAQKLVGMFAFAAYHRPSKQLYLCRDRLGIKPLYYGWAGEQFVFTSELHALAPFRSQLTINRNALASYLRHNYLPAPASIYQEVHKLTPGHTVQIDLRSNTKALTAPSCYWDIAAIAARPVDPRPEAELIEELHALLRTAVADRMLADVPLGAFLSGGYDSSLVCALMQAQSSQPIQTFTIGFDVAKFNEAHHARAVAEHLGTRHTELTVSATDLTAAVDQLPRLMDEPFADSSILPTYLVSKLARQHVTVSLSGDGGDEMFWGYNRYAMTDQLWARTRRFPKPAGALLRQALQWPWLRAMTNRIPAPAWGGRQGSLHQKLTTFSEVWGQSTHQGLYEAMLSHWRQPTEILVAGEPLRTAYNDLSHWSQSFPSVGRMAWQDTITYLPDDILTKVDRASMAVSLEARVPLIDHRVVEFAATLPPQLKAQHGVSKIALREILAHYVPREITDRPKMGFGVPLDMWLRGPLKEWASDLLSPATMDKQGLFHSAPIQALLKQHLDGQANNAAKLWDVLCVQLWLEHQSID